MKEFTIEKRKYTADLNNHLPLLLFIIYHGFLRDTYVKHWLTKLVGVASV